MKNTNESNVADLKKGPAPKKSFVSAFMLGGGQNATLQWLIDNKAPVAIFLVTGVKFEGYIEAFDQYTISIIDIKNRQQLVYKDKISTLALKKPNPQFDGTQFKLDQDN